MNDWRIIESMWEDFSSFIVRQDWNEEQKYWAKMIFFSGAKAVIIVLAKENGLEDQAWAFEKMEQELKDWAEAIPKDEH